MNSELPLVTCPRFPGSDGPTQVGPAIGHSSLPSTTRRFEQIDERGLALGAEVAEQAGVELGDGGVERGEQRQTLGREARRDDAAVARVAAAYHQAAPLQTVEQTRDVPGRGSACARQSRRNRDRARRRRAGCGGRCIACRKGPRDEAPARGLAGARRRCAGCSATPLPGAWRRASPA